MELSKTIQDRYKCQNYQELAERVSNYVGQTKEEKDFYKNLIGRKQFIPAGNNLLAGVDSITPNCCVLPPINEDNFDILSKRSQLLWGARIGIGYDLSTSEDPVKILKQLSALNAEIKLGHRPQRGNIALLKDTHPRIKEFVKCKMEENTLYNFNISVSWTNALGQEEADELLDLMSKASWYRGDPGIVFPDRIQGITGLEANSKGMELINKRLGYVHTLVPCGEQGMFSNEFCNLGSVNLGCKDFWSTNDQGEISFNEKVFKEAVRGGVRFLDQVIDLIEVPDKEIYEMGIQTRRIGLGVMGWADALSYNDIKYGSEESYKLAHLIGSNFKKTAHEESERLGRLKGPAPVLEGTGLIRRNMMITCCPPTGGITLLAGNQGFSIEPVFSEANDLPAKVHIKMQYIWQSYMDNCVSKTVNLPEECTPEGIRSVWNDAIKQGLKCITIYRNESFKDQPLKTGCKSGKCDL